jgi:hypothetical protein
MLEPQTNNNSTDGTDSLNVSIRTFHAGNVVRGNAIAIEGQLLEAQDEIEYRRN